MTGNRFFGWIPEWSQNPVPVKPETECCFKIPVPAKPETECRFEIPVPVNTTRILDKKFRFKPELNRIFIITKIWSLLCLNHCILPNNQLNAHLFFKDFRTIFSFDPGLIGGTNLKAL